MLLKQLADIRAGLRDSPTMYPFAATLTDPQELADVAAYIEQPCIPREHGVGATCRGGTCAASARARRQGRYRSHLRQRRRLSDAHD